MPKRKPTASTRKGKRGKATLRLVKGQLAICVARFPGYQRLAPSQLVRYIPLGKLKQAAKRVLGASGVKRTIRRKKSPETDVVVVARVVAVVDFAQTCWKVNCPSWQRGKSQNVLGSDFVVIEPDNKWEDYPSQVVFQLDSKKPFFFADL